jgi:1-phosphatidylinositol-3-phosphate 5-kinase
MWPDFGFDNSYLPSSSVSEAEEYPLKKKITSSPSEASEAESGIDFEKNGVDMEKSSIVEKRGVDSEKGGLDPENISTEVDVVDGQTPREDKSKSDPDSDSTIGAAREVVATGSVPPESVSFRDAILHSLFFSYLSYAGTRLRDAY